MNRNKSLLLKWGSIALLLIPYLMYVHFVIQADRGPVDYETFMDIGHRLLNGTEVYEENSYYPMPFVMVFAVFSWLPRAASIAIWLLAPVGLALLVTGSNPLCLLFAPLFGHFVGGQTAVFGMLGLWGYRRSIPTRHPIGGLFLGLTLLKPQLGLVPLAFALTCWWKEWRERRQVSTQMWIWVITMLVLYVPGFFLVPDWPARWLSQPRPLFERAMAGFVPRTLLYLVSPQTAYYWGILAALGVLLFTVVWLFKRRSLTLDLTIMLSFIISPLVHDYDLIQLLPLLEGSNLLRLAVILSVPGWMIILFAYDNDLAWYAFTIIAPGILGAMLYQDGKENERTR